MISRARELAERPIEAGERPRLFIAATIVLLITAAVLLAVGRDEDAPEPPVAPIPPAAQAPVPEPHPPVPPPGAERAARRFLPGYLSFLHGRSGPAAIEAAAPALRRAIVRSRPRVPPAARRRRPRVVGIEFERLSSRAVSAAAEVAAGGVSRYTVTLLLRPFEGSWVVIEVGGD